MQTQFTLTQLADAAMKESESILRTCVHCGFCLATCPTYQVLGDELDSPRGRIYQIKDMFEGGKKAPKSLVKHVDRCLSCLSCMTTCPSGVHYMHLVDHARTHIEHTHRRAWDDRLLRSVLARLIPSPTLFRLSLIGARLARPLRHWVPHPRLKAMLELAPDHLPAPSTVDTPGVKPAEGPRRHRVALLNGCAAPVLQPEINEAAVRLLNRMGVDVVVTGAGCCGSLTHHMGKEDLAHRAAKANIDAWYRQTRAGGGAGLDAIIITTSGCGTTVKDYGFMLREDPDWADRAGVVSSLAMDVTEFLDRIGPLTPVPDRKDQAGTLALTYHAACSLQHGQKVTAAPKALLKAAGFRRLKEPRDSHLCCGSAGTYNMLQPDISQQLKARKLAAIGETGPDLVAAGNIGCMTQLREKNGVPVVHTVELLDWVTGGPAPAGLDRVLAAPADRAA